jgi:hypothetical protein
VLHYNYKKTTRAKPWWLASKVYEIIVMPWLRGDGYFFLLRLIAMYSISNASSNATNCLSSRMSFKKENFFISILLIIYKNSRIEIRRLTVIGNALVAATRF